MRREYGLGEVNSEGKFTLEFLPALALTLENTWFKKRDKHLITYKCGVTYSQIDLFVIRNHMDVRINGKSKRKGHIGAL